MFTYVCHLITFFICIEGVFGVHSDGVKSVSVTEGDSLTLNTDVTEIQRDDQILWLFGPKRTRIAQIFKQDIDMFSSNVIFGDRLKMDSQTGSLTITDITTEHSGLYKLQRLSDTGTSETTFNIIVYAPLPIPNITHNSPQCSSSNQNCSVLCSVFNVSHVTLSWLKGNRLLSSISVSDLSISLSLPLEVEDQDENTYSCVINNPVKNQTTHLNNSELCQPCLDTPTEDVIVSLIYAVVGVTAVALLVYYVRYKRENGRGKMNSPSQPH